jgi:hypothetical protein
MRLDNSVFVFLVFRASPMGKMNAKYLGNEIKLAGKPK